MKKINKLLIKFDICLMFLLLCVFCWNGLHKMEGITYVPTSNIFSENVNPESPYTFGWSTYNSQVEFFDKIGQGIFDKAEELGIDVITHDQKSSTIEMTTGVPELLNQDIDALLISPYNPLAMENIIELAKEKGIPIIAIGVGLNDREKLDASVISDIFGGGVLAGEYALKLIKEHNLPSKNVAILKLKETSDYGRQSGTAFEQVMKDAGYNIVAKVNANSERENAYNETKKILENYKDDLAVIFAENDRMALGAAQAVDEAGKKGEIMVLGFNGEPSAIEAIKNRSMQGTIAQRPYEMGELGVEIADTILNGGKVTFDNTQKKEIYAEVNLIDENGVLQPNE